MYHNSPKSINSQNPLQISLDFKSIFLFNIYRIATFLFKTLLQILHCNISLLPIIKKFVFLLNFHLLFLLMKSLPNL